MSDTRDVLIEEIGLSIEERLRLSPLSARIYALLTLSSYDGLSFDEIKAELKASKSSISVNINVLLQLKYIKYVTKSGDRKRYFKVAKYFQLQSLAQLHESLEKDIEIVDKINGFNEAHFPEKYMNEKSLGTITKDFFRDQQAIINKAIEKIDEFRKGDTNY